MSTAAEAAGATVPLDRIEAEFARQLREGQKAGEAPVRRARLSNLLIYCTSEEQVQSVTANAPAIIAVHPARILLLAADAAGPARITSAVHVWHPFPDDPKLVCEQVTLRAGSNAIDKLPFEVRRLLIGDLPINLWWLPPVPPTSSAALLFDLAEDAQQVIYDSIGWSEPARGVIATAAWLNQIEPARNRPTKFPMHDVRWRAISDLNWRRLKFWRRLLGQVLDPASAPGALGTISEVLVEHGPHAVVQAWELVSWLASRLGWTVSDGKVEPNVEIAWQVATKAGTVRVRLRRLPDGPSELRRVHIACQVNGQAGAFDCRVTDDRRLAAVPQGFPGEARTVTPQWQSVAELVARQLSDRDRDPVFRESMAVAQVFARSVS